VAVCGLLALAAAAALAAKLVPGADGSPGASARVATRTWPLTLAPAPDDIALAQISFPAGGDGRLPAGSLRVAVDGPFGDDYMALAVPRAPTHGSRRALVLLVNRPSPLLDPVRVHLGATAWRALGTPAVRVSENPFARARAAAKPALCDLPTPHGDGLDGARLAALASRGTPPQGFGAAAAVAAAYDVVCALPAPSAFEQAVTHPSGVASPPPSQEPAPAEPQPAPPREEQPVGKLPGEGCQPTPGYACPGVATAGARIGGRRAGTGAH